MILGRMWIGVVLCVICRYIGDFVTGVEIPETHSVKPLCFVSAESANDVVGIRQDFSDLV